MNKSKVSKKKYVVGEILNNYELPVGEQKIVKVVRSCGNNLHEVATPEGDTYLASMPSKFRKHIWIKRGDFVVVEPIEEGAKVKGEISQILLKDQIKFFKDQGVWPKGFTEDNSQSSLPNSSDSDLFVNTNRPEAISSSDESSATDVESDDPK